MLLLRALRELKRNFGDKESLHLPDRSLEAEGGCEPRGRPANLLAYSEVKPGLATLAAAYAFGTAQNLPFFDGNKRTAYIVCRTFLILNGHDLDATREEKYWTFLKLARGELSEAELSAWIQERLVRRQ